MAACVLCCFSRSAFFSKIFIRVEMNYIFRLGLLGDLRWYNKRNQASPFSVLRRTRALSFGFCGLLQVSVFFGFKQLQALNCRRRSWPRAHVATGGVYLPSVGCTRWKNKIVMLRQNSNFNLCRIHQERSLFPFLSLSLPATARISKPFQRKRINREQSASKPSSAQRL